MSRHSFSTMLHRVVGGSALVPHPLLAGISGWEMWCASPGTCRYGAGSREWSLDGLRVFRRYLKEQIYKKNPYCSTERDSLEKSKGALSDPSCPRGCRDRVGIGSNMRRRLPGLPVRGSDGTRFVQRFLYVCHGYALRPLRPDCDPGSCAWR